MDINGLKRGIEAGFQRMRHKAHECGGQIERLSRMRLSTHESEEEK